MQTPDFFRSRIEAMINLSPDGLDLFGPTQVLVGAGRSNAGRPKLPIRLMASLLANNVRNKTTFFGQSCLAKSPKNMYKYRTGLNYV